MVVAVKQDYLYVRWDSFLETRHSCSGRCERGHGWNLPSSHVELAEAVDLGEFEANLEPGSIDDLLGGLL